MAPRPSASSLVVKARVLAMLLVVAGLLATRIFATDAPAAAPTPSPVCGSGVTFSPVSGVANGLVNAPYSQTLTPLGGGTAPYTFAVQSGSLPAGLSLSTGGVISGIPTSVGSVSATVRVEDALGCVGSQDLVIVINSQSNSSGVSVVDASIGRLLRLASGNTDSVPNNAFLTGSREWGFNIFNHDLQTFTNPTIQMTSTLGGTGLLSPENTNVAFPFSFSKTTAILNNTSVADDSKALREGIRNTTVMGNNTPGFDASRSISPATVPAGGGLQTVTVSVRLVDPRYAGTNPNININVFGQCQASSAPDNLTQGEFFSTNCTVGSGASSLNNVQLNKQYVFTFTMFTPNNSVNSLTSKPALSVQSTVYHVPGIVAGTSVSIDDNTLAGGAQFSLDQFVEWHPSVDDTYLIDFPASSAQVNGTTTTVQLSQNTNPVYGFQHSVDLSVIGQPNQPAGGTYQVTVDGGAATTVFVNPNGPTGFNLGSLAVGQHTVTAVYSGDNFYTGSTGSLTFNIAKAPPQFQWGVPAQYNYGLTTSANVTFQTTGSQVPPTGNVTYQIDGGGLPNAGIGSNPAAASLQIPVLPAGMHTISWSYSGDDHFTPSTTQSGSFTINRSTPNVFVSTAPIIYGSNAQIAIVVSSLFMGSAAPLGQVSYSVDGGPASFANLVVSPSNSTQGTVPVQLGVLAGGSHSVTVNYLGDNNYNPATGQAPLTVNPTPTNLSLQASPNSAPLGTNITFTATVNHANGPAVPTGTVTFTIDGTTQLTANVNNTGSASVSTNQLTSGNHTVSAKYNGDSNYNTSSNSTNVNINAAQTTTSLTSSLNPSTLGTNVTFTATVTVTTTGVPVTAGTVVFKDNNATTIATVAVNGSGVATATTNALTSGTHNISASYTDGALFSASFASMQQQVNAPLFAPSFSQILARPAGACICTPVVMNFPSTGTQNWWFKATSSVTLTAFAHAVNSIDPETLRVRIYTQAGVQVGSDIVTGYPGGTPNDTETSASLTVATTANAVYRVEVATPGTVGTQPHYRLKLDGAQELGQNTPTANNFEDGEMLWLMNAGANEPVQVGVITNSLTPAVSSNMATHAELQIIDMSAPGVPVPLEDLSGNSLGTSYVINGGDGLSSGINANLQVAPSYIATHGAARIYALSIVDINGHYRLTRGPSADRAIYVGWTASEEQPLTINVTAGNTAFSGVVHATATNLISGQQVGERDFAVGTFTDKITGGRYHITFTAPAGYTATPASIDVDVLCDQPTVLNVRVDDLTPPTLTLTGGAMTIEAGSTFTDPGATANDTAAGNLTAAIQVTGSVNANVPGTYILTYSVSDGPNTTTTTRTVTVVDTTAPTIDPHADITTIATGTNGATVTYTSPATHDFVDGTGTAQCVPASGSTFAVGVTTVTCTASDAHGNVATPTTFTVTVTSATTTTLTSGGPSAVGAAATFTATVTAVSGTPTGTVTFMDGSTVLGTAAVDASGHATFSTTTLAAGDHTITAVYGGSTYYTGSNSGPLAHIVYTFASTGAFVIGDLNSAVGTQVTFWGAQWSKLNGLSGGNASASFKGFANSTSSSPIMAGGSWTTDPGNSSQPPSSVGRYVAVIVASRITKSGSTISGNIPMVVIVRTDAGYAGNPGHEGTGVVVAIVR